MSDEFVVPEGIRVIVVDGIRYSREVLAAKDLIDGAGDMGPYWVRRKGNVLEVTTHAFREWEASDGTTRKDRG